MQSSNLSGIQIFFFSFHLFVRWKFHVIWIYASPPFSPFVSMHLRYPKKTIEHTA